MIQNQLFNYYDISWWFAILPHLSTSGKRLWIMKIYKVWAAQSWPRIAWGHSQPSTWSTLRFLIQSSFLGPWHAVWKQCGLSVSKNWCFFTVKSSRIEWTGDWFFGKSKKKSWVISQNLITADHPPQFLNYLSLPFHLSHGQPNQTNQPTAANGVHMANPRIHWWKQRPEPMKQKTSGTLATVLQTKKNGAAKASNTCNV